jgi:hypothetical protein
MMFLQTCPLSEYFTLALGGVRDLFCYFDLMLRYIPRILSSSIRLVLGQINNRTITNTTQSPRCIAPTADRSARPSWHLYTWKSRKTGIHRPYWTPRNRFHGAISWSRMERCFGGIPREAIRPRQALTRLQVRSQEVVHFEYIYKDKYSCGSLPIA